MFDNFLHNEYTECNIMMFNKKQKNKYIDVQSRKSFSKSQQKKLKLITKSLSISKNTTIEEKRSIKPLKIIITQNKSSLKNQQNNYLCSIKHFKNKINSQKNQIDQITLKYNPQTNPINIVQININENNSQKDSQNFKSNQYYYPSFGPSFGNSLIRQTQNSTKHQQKNDILSTQKATQINSSNQNFNTNPKSSINNSISTIQLNTPPKNKYFTEQYIISDRQRKQKLTLNNARKVETLQTLKTENDLQMSFIDDNSNEYHNIFGKNPFSEQVSFSRFQKHKATQ